MGTRGRFKGWKSAKAIAAMTPAEKAEYDALVARIKAERNAEKIAKGIDPEKEEAEKKAMQAKREEKQVNLQNLISSQLEYQRTHIMSQDEDEEEKNGKPWYQENNANGDYKETTIDHLSGEGFCTIETNEDFWIRKIAEMIEKTPDKVIIDENYTKGDILRVKIPYSCMKKIKTSARTVSEEQRQRMSELGKQATGRKRGRPRKNPIWNLVDITTPIENPIGNLVDITTEGSVKSPVEEETDEEFENTPMNRFLAVEEDEDILSEQEKLTGVEDKEESNEDSNENSSEEPNEDSDEDSDEDFTYCNFGTMSFGEEPTHMVAHFGPEDNPNDDIDEFYGEEY